MKKLRNLFYATGALLLLGACSSDRTSTDVDFDFSHKTTVNFSATVGIESRAIDSQWTRGDAIGVYAIEAGKALEDGSIYNEKSNIKHTTIGGAEGKFTAADPLESIQLKGDKSIDIIAYYPFTEPVTDYIYNVNVTDQSNPEKIDLLYSDNIKGLNTAGTAEMNFTHQLSQLVINIETGSGISSLNGLQVNYLKGFIAEGTFKLADKEFALKSGASKVALKPQTEMASGNRTAVLKAILLPTQDLKHAELELVLNGEVFNWSPSIELVMEPGKKYTYTIQLSQDGVITLNPGSTIEDWVEGNTNDDTEVITPEDPKDSDFTVDKTTLDFNAEATNNTFSITAEADAAWTVESSAAWCTVTPLSGKGNQTVTVTATKNSTTADRTAQITVKGGETTATITVNQKGEKGDLQEVVLVKEGFSKLDVGVSFQVADFAKEYKEYADHPELDYKVSYFRGMLRRTTQINGHIWFAFAHENSFEMNNIPTDGATDLVLEFDLVADNAGTKAKAITVQVNGKKLVDLPDEMLSNDTYKTYSLEIGDVDTDTISIVFENTPSLMIANGARLDNIVVKGMK